MVTFYCPGGGGKAYLVGDFNGWRAAKPMQLEGGRYRQTLRLPPGGYAYACRTRGGGITAPLDAPAYVDDGFGGRNGYIRIGAPEAGK